MAAKRLNRQSGPLTKASDIRSLLNQADAGEAEALSRVKELFRELPELRDLFGDLGQQARQSAIEMCCGKERGTSIEAVMQKAASMLVEIEGPAPSPLEKLLANRVILCWIHLHYVDILFARTVSNAILLDHAIKYQKWIDRAQKRYLAAIKALAEIRRLPLPTVQVNIGAQQLNVASSHPSL